MMINYNDILQDFKQKKRFKKSIEVKESEFAPNVGDYRATDLRFFLAKWKKGKLDLQMLKLIETSQIISEMHLFASSDLPLFQDLVTILYLNAFSQNSFGKVAKNILVEYLCIHSNIDLVIQTVESIRPTKRFDEFCLYVVETLLQRQTSEAVICQFEKILQRLSEDSMVQMGKKYLRKDSFEQLGAMLTNCRREQKSSFREWLRSSIDAVFEEDNPEELSWSVYILLTAYNPTTCLQELFAKAKQSKFNEELLLKSFVHIIPILKGHQVKQIGTLLTTHKLTRVSEVKKIKDLLRTRLYDFRMEKNDCPEGVDKDTMKYLNFFVKKGKAHPDIRRAMLFQQRKIPDITLPALIRMENDEDGKAREFLELLCKDKIVSTRQVEKARAQFKKQHKNQSRFSTDLRKLKDFPEKLLIPENQAYAFNILQESLSNAPKSLRIEALFSILCHSISLLMKSSPMLDPKRFSFILPFNRVISSLNIQSELTEKVKAAAIQKLNDCQILALSCLIAGSCLEGILIEIDLLEESLPVWTSSFGVLSCAYPKLASVLPMSLMQRMAWVFSQRNYIQSERMLCFERKCDQNMLKRLQDIQRNWSVEHILKCAFHSRLGDPEIIAESALDTILQSHPDSTLSVSVLISLFVENCKHSGKLLELLLSRMKCTYDLPSNNQNVQSLSFSDLLRIIKVLPASFRNDFIQKQKIRLLSIKHFPSTSQLPLPVLQKWIFLFHTKVLPLEKSMLDVFPAFVAKIIQRPMKSFCAPTVKKISEFFPAQSKYESNPYVAAYLLPLQNDNILNSNSKFVEASLLRYLYRLRYSDFNPKEKDAILKLCLRNKEFCSHWRIQIDATLAAYFFEGFERDIVRVFSHTILLQCYHALYFGSKKKESESIYLRWSSISKRKDVRRWVQDKLGQTKRIKGGKLISQVKIHDPDLFANVQIEESRRKRKRLKESPKQTKSSKKVFFGRKFT